MMNLYEIFRKCGTVATDSRTLKGGELFFALKGENFDGNRYALKALEAGAAYAVVSDASLLADAPADGEGNPRIIAVADTLAALQELARTHRSMTLVDGRPLCVVGLTGTNGKTTTKELVKAVLSVKYRVTATEGNLNNSIGVPLTLLKIDSGTQIAVVEMGASHPGDIEELVAVSLPDYGLITNVGTAHILGFGSFDGVKRTKGELYDWLQRTGGKAFLNADNPHLCEMVGERPGLAFIPYGLDYSGAHVLPVTEDEPYLRIGLASGNVVCTQLVGSYNADNVMSALAVGREFGISEEDAVRAICAYVPANSRSQMMKTERNTLIVDAYNANPTSVEAALDSFEAIRADRKMVMLGNMLELGKVSFDEHRKVVERLAEMKVPAFLVGEEYRLPYGQIAAGYPECRWFPDSEELCSALEKSAYSGYTILVKGSRGSRMERVIPAL